MRCCRASAARAAIGHPPPRPSSPGFAAAAGAVYVVGREIFAAGYTNGGADKRMAGAIVLDLALVAMMGACVVGGARHAGLLAAVAGK